MSTITGIFDDVEAKLYARYLVRLRFTDLVMGGVPQKPEIIESWIRQRIEGGDAEMQRMVLRTLDELGVDLDDPELATYEQRMEAAKRIAAERNGNTFRRDDQGLYLSDYQIKAALKEAASIIYPGGQGAGTHKWGATRKAPRSFLAERIFVDQPRIHFAREDGSRYHEPDGTHLIMGKVNGPRGPRSILSYYDYLERPFVEFAVSSLEDAITPEQWATILVTGQRQGIGAARSLGNGQYKVVAFERIGRDQTRAAA